MIWPSLLSLFILSVSSLGFGAPLVRRLRLHPAESLCLAVGVSWLIVFYICFAGYLFGSLTAVCAPVLAASCLSLAIGWRQVRRWIRCRFTRSMLLAFVALLAWFELYHAGETHYAVGTWWGDWFEHYQRMVFWVIHPPMNTRFLNGMYTLPSRPPMQNICQAYVAALTDQGFALFQVSSTFLATLLCLPAFVMLRRLAQGGRASVWLTAALLALNWPFLTHATYTWTKAFAGYYILVGLALYMKGGRLRQTLAFGSLGAGIVVHYSTGLTLVPLVIWHLATKWNKPRDWPWTIGVGIPGALVIVPWLLFVKFHFPGGPLSETYTSQTIGRLTYYEWFRLGSLNSLITLVPVYSSLSMHVLAKLNPAGGLSYYRDFLAMVETQTWPGAIGATGLIVTIIELIRLRKPGPMRTHLLWLWAFWTWVFLGTMVALGVAQPLEADFGTGQISMLPFIVTTAAWIAGAWPRFSRPMRWTLALLAVVQGLVGPLAAGYLITGAPTFPDGTSAPGFAGLRPTLSSYTAMLNFRLKTNHHLIYIADLIGPGLSWVFAFQCVGIGMWILVLIANALPRSPRFRQLRDVS